MRYAIAVVLALALVPACEATSGPGMGLDAGPGSPECRRAIYHITHPGEDAYHPRWREYERTVLEKCVGGGGGGDEDEDDKPTMW